MATGPTAFDFRLGSGRDRIADLSLDEGDTIRLTDAIGATASWVEGGSAFIDLGGGNVIEFAGLGAENL